MNDLLISWGFPAEYADMLDETIVAVLIILLAVGLNYFFQAVVAGGIKRYIRRFPRRWNTLLVERKVIHHLLHVVPGVLIYALLPVAFVKGKGLLDFSQRMCAIYIIVALLLTLNSVLLVMLDIYNSKEIRKNHPIRGLVQVLQVLIFFLGGIMVVSVLIDKSPVTLFAGLGAAATVLMLIFKDSILGFVSGVQLSANDMLRIGDWVTLPNGSADGIVKEITLNTVKIQNWDNTITTIPPYTMVNSTFQNWRGMQESGGRRVDKRIWLDLDTVRFTTAQELDNLRTVKRKEVADKIKVARGYGDLSENAEYDAAKEEQAIVEARIADLEATLKVARIIDDNDLSQDTVSIGMRVKILAVGDDEDEAEEYDITGSTEADMDYNRISDESPVGAALVGHKAGDEVAVTLPNGNIIDYKILAVSRSK